MTELETIKTEIEALKKRNKQVEANKAWETSLTRKILILVCTYIIIGFTFTELQNPTPWLNAIIPTVGFFVSTLTFPFMLL